jgi:hypothetical protein
MNRKTLWQITAIASAAALVGIAQAQSDTSTSAAPMTTEDRVAAEAAEMAAQPVVTPDAAASQTTVDTSAQTAAGDATASSVPQSTTIVVVPTQVDHAAVHAKAWSAWEAESATPVTREDVVAETHYAMQNGLIPRGEIGTVNEDKGSMGPELADQARHERSTQQVYAKVESRYQQMAAAEQERLNQLALAEQQRQQALAAQQQQQALAQPQQPQQPQQ